MERKKYRVFLDSNVILSGLFSDKGSPRLILDLLCLDLPALVGLTGRFNQMEVERNLERKLPATLPTFRLYLPKMKLEVIALPTPEDLRTLAGSADEKDLPALASALAGRADFFATGDKSLISAINKKAAFPFRPLSPAEFLATVLPGLLGGSPRR